MPSTSAESVFFCFLFFVFLNVWMPQSVLREPARPEQLKGKLFSRMYKLVGREYAISTSCFYRGWQDVRSSARNIFVRNLYHVRFAGPEISSLSILSANHCLDVLIHPQMHQTVFWALLDLTVDAQIFKAVDLVDVSIRPTIHLSQEIQSNTFVNVSIHPMVKLICMLRDVFWKQVGIVGFCMGCVFDWSWTNCSVSNSRSRWCWSVP